MYIANIRIDFELTKTQILQKINSLIKQGGIHQISTINPEFIMSAQKDSEFMKMLNLSTICTPDGAGTFLAKEYLEKVSGWPKNLFFPVFAFVFGTVNGVLSAFRYKKPLGRITGVELIKDICELAEQNGHSVFFLGGLSDVAGQTAKIINKLYPSLMIVGSASQFSYSASDDEKTLEYIKECMNKVHVDNIDVLFVAYGHNKQERWIARNSMKIPATVSVGVGGSFDFISNRVKRAPKFLRSVGLEWLFRLFIQPWRLKRALLAFPIFPVFIYLLSVKDHNK